MHFCAFLLDQGGILISTVLPEMVSWRHKALLVTEKLIREQEEPMNNKETIME
jgi:hypothetical protein